MKTTDLVALRNAEEARKYSKALAALSYLLEAEHWDDVHMVARNLPDDLRADLEPLRESVRRERERQVLRDLRQMAAS